MMLEGKISKILCLKGGVRSSVHRQVYEFEFPALYGDGRLLFR